MDHIVKIQLHAADAEFMLAEIDVAIAEINRCYSSLPTPARLSALSLGHSLAGFRSKLIGAQPSVPPRFSAIVSPAK